LKNLLVFVPFGLSLGHIGRGGMVMALLAFVSLCLMTSGSYLINDMFDLEADRRHPRKRRRPIAAGDVSLPVAALASLGLIGTALLLGLALKPLFAGALASYLCITLAYSFRLKRLAMVDVLVIAVLFTLRILAGMLMVSEAPSHWLLMFSIFFFLSLAFMKREVEFNVMHLAGRQVLSGRGYAMEDRMYVLSCGLSSGMASIVIFGLFISETASLQQANYGAPILLWGVMFCLTYWILRMWLLTTRGLMNDDPILFAAQDRTSILIAAASALLAVGSQVLVFR
jgi:4-hydroxybenzoate polyprenyltransferase